MKTWVRFEKKYVRYHLVLAEEHGGYYTYCGRFHRATTVIDTTASPPAQCRCCTSRQQRPYLVPEKLLSLRPQEEVKHATN